MPAQTFQPEFRQLIREMVEEAFIAKCYDKTDVDAASFWIGCRYKSEIRGTPYSDTGIAEYTEGTLVIFIVDAKTKQRIWHGWAQARMKKSYPPENKRERLQQAVAAIVHEIPSRDKPLRKGEH
jgi:hypothetical protein